MSVLEAIRMSRAPILPFATMGAGWGTFAAYVPEIKAGLGVGDGAFGALLLFSSFGLLSAMWLAPRLDDTLHRLALPVAAGLLALSFLLPGLVSAPALFALVMVCLGATSGLTDVVMNARVSELEARHGRSLMNVNHAVFSFAYAGAAVVCSFARNSDLPSISVFVWVTVIGIALTPFMRGKIPVDAAEPADGAFPTGVVVWGGLIVMVGFLIENSMEGWSALHIERTLGGIAAEGALGPAVLGLTMGIGRLSGQVIAGRRREEPVLVAAAVLACCGLWIAATASVPIQAYLGFGIAGLGVSVVAPMALALIGRNVSNRSRTRAIARASVIGFMGFLIGPTVVGGLSELAGLRVAFATVALFALCVPPLLWLMRSGSSAPRNPRGSEGYRGRPR